MFFELSEAQPLYLFPYWVDSTSLNMDRGFYSATNVAHLDQNHITFLIPLTMSVKQFSSLRAKHARQLSNPANSFLFKDDVLYHVQDVIAIDKVLLHAHLYFNPQSRSEQTAHFLRKILDAEAFANQ